MSDLIINQQGTAEIMTAIQNAYVNWYNNRVEGEVKPTRETIVGRRNS